VKLPATLNVETFKREYPPPFFWLFGRLALLMSAVI